MSTTSNLLLLDDERKAQLDLLNNIDQAGTNFSFDLNVFSSIGILFQRRLIFAMRLWVIYQLG
jgi:hypothetical protein